MFFDFEADLKLAQKRGELMNKFNRQRTMAAILCITSAQVLKVLSKNNLSEINIAGYNTYMNTTISGLKDQIMKSEKAFGEIEAEFVPLKVSGAFHSKLMQDAKKEFHRFLRRFSFKSPEFPVICNVNAKLYRTNEIASYSAQHPASPAKRLQSIKHIEAQGEQHFIEIGHGQTLLKFKKRIINIKLC